MIGFWVFIYAVYFLAPIIQTPPVSLTGAAFVGSLVLVFCTSSVLASHWGGGFLVPASTASAAQLNVGLPRLINILFLIGISGAILSLYGKIISVEDISFCSFASLRTERAQQLLAARALSSSVLSGIGFLAYPAGFVAIVITLIRFEALPAFTRLLSIFYVPLLFLLSMVSGGRSTIFVIILFLGLAVYVRYCQGRTAIPKSQGAKSLLVILLIAFLGYSTLIWKVRAECSGQSPDAFLAHAEKAWGVKPTASLESLTRGVAQPDQVQSPPDQVQSPPAQVQSQPSQVLSQSSLVQSLVSSIFYVTQSLSIIERVLGMNEPPVLLGAYHIDLVAAALRASPGGSEFLAEGYSALLNSNVYGFFTSAWGALYIDFGLAGCYIATLLWGGLAGSAYRLARRNIYSGGVTQYVFWMYSILISFVSPPFGFSNSAVIFAWFLIYYLLRPQEQSTETTHLIID